MFQDLSTFHRIYVGYSGGLDSTVLLHQLIQIETLKQRVTAIHVNHGLHPEANAWQKHGETFCNTHAIPLIIKHAGCKKGPNQEALARAARYQQFDSCIQPGEVLLLGHHLQDQAETVLLNLCRGSGVDGLCGMWQTRAQQGYTVMRPLLDQPREALYQYAQAHHLSWVEDSSNQETQYSRNYLRHTILPLLRARWPQIDKSLYQAAQHMQTAQLNLQDLARTPSSLRGREAAVAIHSPVFHLEHLTPPHRLSNTLWFWLKENQIPLLSQAMVEKIIQVLIVSPQAKGKRLIFKDKQIWRHQDALHITSLRAPKGRSNPRGITWNGFPAPLSHTLGHLHAIEKEGHLQLPERADVELRFREATTIRLHGQTKSLKKLFQAWKIPAWQRSDIPLIYVNGALAMVVGYAISDDFYTEQAGWKIEWIS